MMNIFKKRGMGRLHGNHALYWEYQQRVAKEKLIPTLRDWGIDPDGKHILEVGSGDGGIIHSFAEMGALCTGIELNKNRAEIGKQFASHDIPVVYGDFCKKDILDKIDTKFDLILVRDVLEHLLDKDTALENLYSLLKDGGFIFFDFPPWYSPFAGHQQALKSFLRYIPYFHLLPRNLYARILYWSEGGNTKLYRDLVDTYDSRITFNRFFKLLEKYDLEITKSRYFLINPSYEIKFGLPEIRLHFFSKIPVLREIISSNIYALIKKKH